MSFIAGIFIGTMLGVGVMCVMAMASDCNGDCDQGRRCNCAGGGLDDQAHH